MLHDHLLGALFGFVLAALATPVGVSGAVFLVPVQVSLLHVPSPSVTPTNLLYNVVSAPGGLWRYARTQGLRGPLVRMLAIGTLPGVVIGAILRVEVLDGPRAFLFVLAVVLGPLGLWLVLPSRRTGRSVPSSRPVGPLALLVGVVGGVYGIGGGSILAPILTAFGYSLREVAPAALAATFLTSVVGVGTYAVLQQTHGGSIAPQWGLGLTMGGAGLVGSYVGAWLQPHLPERLLRRLLGLLAVVVAARYLALAL